LTQFSALFGRPAEATRPMARCRSTAMSFHVGQQVVCVSERFSDEEHWRASVRTFPKLHAVYTIREIIVGDVLVGFCFHEFSNPRAHFRNGFHEPAFNSRNFRPVRKTSIEIFEKLLAPRDLVGVD
jgi:hypothetical protein